MSYTRAQLKDRMNAGIHGKQGMLVDANETLNQAVREVKARLDLRSSRRSAQLTPAMVNGKYDYFCPADLDAFKIIDIPGQAVRYDGEFRLVPPEEFATNGRAGDIAIKDANGTRILQVYSTVDSNDLIASTLDSLTAGASDGTSWSDFGDAENVEADTDDFVRENGALKFDIDSSGGTTAGIVHTAINAIDMTDYFGGAAAFFLFARVTSTTGLTSFTIRFGNDSSNYWSKTVTARHDGTAFTTGWNPLRFSIASLTTTGSPTASSVDYFAIYMNKAISKISESDYAFDQLSLKRGKYHNIEYYSQYGWTTSGGTYLQDSTDDSDLLVAGPDEYEIIVTKATEKALREVREYEDAREQRAIYDEAIRHYELQNPSEAKIMSSEYHRYAA